MTEQWDKDTSPVENGTVEQEARCQERQGTARHGERAFARRRPHIGGGTQEWHSRLSEQVPRQYADGT